MEWSAQCFEVLCAAGRCHLSVRVKHDTNLLQRASTPTLQGVEKSVVARHEVGHALVATGARMFLVSWVAAGCDHCTVLVVLPLCNQVPQLHRRGWRVECRRWAGIAAGQALQLGRHRSWACVPHLRSSSSSPSAAVAALLPGFAGQAEKLSIIPRTGGALGFTYIPPKTEDR